MTFQLKSRNSFLASLQRVDGAPSDKGYTREEFLFAMQEMMTRLRAARERRKKPLRSATYFIWDHCSAHSEAGLKLNIADKLIVTPSHSFEFNVVVEHCFNIIKSRFNHEVITDHSIDTIEAAADYLIEMIPKWITKGMLQRDANKMKGRMQRIIDVGGDRIF